MNKLSLTTTPEGHLLSLPRELRDDIFVPLLRAGNVAILRTSKQIHDEAKELLFHEATFRVKVGFAGGPVNSFPINWKSIERFHFRIYVGTGNTLLFQPTFRLFDHFTDLDGTSRKRECLISIEYDHDNVRWDFAQRKYPASLSGKLACLNTFTTVVVKFVCQCGDGSASAFWRNHSAEIFAPWYKKGRMADKWTVLEEELEPGLGTGRLEWGKDEGERLVFHPQQYHSSRAGKAAGLLVEN